MFNKIYFIFFLIVFNNCDSKNTINSKYKKTIITEVTKVSETVYKNRKFAYLNLKNCNNEIEEVELSQNKFLDVNIKNKTNILNKCFKIIYDCNSLSHLKVISKVHCNCLENRVNLIVNLDSIPLYERDSIEINEYLDGELVNSSPLLDQKTIEYSFLYESLYMIEFKKRNHLAKVIVVSTYNIPINEIKIYPIEVNLKNLRKIKKHNMPDLILFKFNHSTDNFGFNIKKK